MKKKDIIQKYWKSYNPQNPSHILLLIVGGFLVGWIVIAILKVLLVPALIIGLIYVIIKWKTQKKK